MSGYKRMKKHIALLLCWSLLCNLISITKVNLHSPISNHSIVEVKGSFFVGNIAAQSESLSLSAKSENSDMAQYYLPMLAMLGIGIMSIMLWTKLESKSADFYLFLIGAVTYLVSVITSWTSEKTKFEKLPETIAKNTQVSALEEQKKAYEEVLKMVEKRLVLQGATTAAFLAAAILAGVFYTQERAALAASQQTTAALASEFAAKCSQIPQMYPPNGVAVDATTMAPIAPVCMKVAAMGVACLKEVGASEAQISVLNEALRAPQGSATMALAHEDQVDSIAQTSSECFDSQIPSPTQGELVSYSDPELKGRLKQHYYTQGIDLSQEKSLVIVSDKPSSKVTKYVVQVIEELIEEAQAGPAGILGNAVSRGGGQAVSQATGEAASGAATFLDDTPDNFIQQLSANPDRAMSNCQRRSNCTEADLQRYVELNSARANFGSTVVGSTADAGVGKAVQVAARTGGRRVATRVASGVAIRVVGAGAAAVGTAVGAPVIVAGASVALAGYTAYSVGQAGYNVITAQTKVMRAEEAARRENMDCRQTRRGVRCRPKTSFINNFDKKRMISILSGLLINDSQASATASVATSALQGVGNQAVEIAEDVSQESESEADQWLYNPKGRMALFGAFSALVGMVTLNTNKMKKNLEDDIEVIQETIDEYSRLNEGNSQIKEDSNTDTSLDIEDNIIIPEDVNLNEDTDQSVFYKSLRGLMSLFFNEAVAAKKNVLGVMPLTIPCLAPMNGNCVSTRSFVSSLLLKGVNYSPSTKQAIKSTALMGDMIQRRNYVTEDFMQEVSKLNRLRPSLEMGYQLTKKKLARGARNNSTDFDKYEKHLVQKFLGISKKAIANKNINLGSLLSIGTFNGRRNEPREASSRVESSSLALNNNQAKVFYTQQSKGAFITEDSDSNERNYIDKARGINTSLNENLFEQVSRRYLIWHSRQ